MDDNLVDSFQELCDRQVVDFIDASDVFGEPLTTMAVMVQKAFRIQLQFITDASRMFKPDDRTVQSMQEPIFSIIQTIQRLKETNRQSEFFNHMSTVAESIVALNWTNAPRPAKFIQDWKEAGDFFGNRVLSASKKASNPHDHVAWINKWSNVLQTLQQYVNEFHKTGLTWNVARKSRGMTSLPIAPPPPPLPTATFISSEESAKDSASEDRKKLMDDINQGLGITERLKSAKLRDTPEGVRVPRHSDVAAASTSRKPAPTQSHVAPSMFLDGRKWRIEEYRNNENVLLTDGKMSETVAIFKCENSVIKIDNKRNGVSIDNCKGCDVFVDDIISSIDLIRCDRVRLRCMGHVPLVNLDNCDSCSVFLTQSSIDAEIISAKSSSLNVCLVTEDGSDYDELSVPEQIKSVVVNGKLKSEALEKI